MDFRKATDELMTAVTRDEIASALDCSLASVRQAKLDESAKAYRKPPAGWEKALLKLAEAEAERFRRLALKLRS